MKTCLYCGHESVDRSVFCSYCGSRFVTSKNEKKDSKWSIAGKIALYVALFFALQTVISIAIGLVGGIIVAIPNLNATPEELTTKLDQFLSGTLPIVSLITNVIYVLGISVFFGVRKKNPLKETSISKFPIWMLPLCAIFGYCVNPVISFLSAFIPWPNAVVEYFNSGTEELVSGNFIITLISISIVTGIVEEFLFRGIVITRLRRVYGDVTAVMISAVIFAAVHLNPVSFIGIFLLAVFLGFLFIRTGSIVPGMIVHAFFNLFAILGYASENEVFILGFLSICIALSLGCGYLLLLKRKEKANDVISDVES